MGSALLGLLEASLEALDLTSGIDQTLLTREKRMTRRTHVDVQTLFGRSRLPGIAAATGDGGHVVIGMDACLHCAMYFL